MADIRCPRHPVRLFLRVGNPQTVEGENVLEVACRDCCADERRQSLLVIRVLHRFDTAGRLVGTEIVYADPRV